MTRKLVIPLAAGAGMAMTLSPWPASAMLEEVIVTAQKREENVQTVPIAVSALSEETLRNASMLTMDDVSRQVPGFTVTTYNPVTPQPYIRGIGSNVSDAGADASVGVFIDGVYAGRAGGYRADMYDIERVEVLRGPQGTLFGRNVAGGALSIFSNRPSQEAAAELELTAGDYDLWGVKGMINGSLGSRAAGRLAFATRERDGDTDNTVSGNTLRDEDNQSARARLLWDASDTVTLLLTGEYSEDDLQGPSARNFWGADPSVVLESTGIGFLSPFLLPSSPDPWRIEAAVDGFADREMYAATAQLDWDLGFGNLTSITGYRDLEYRFLDDVFGLAFDPASGIEPLLTNAADEESDQLSQEVRITSSGEGLVWTAGLYYLQENVDRDETFSPLGDAVLYDQASDTSSYAAFGQVTLALADRLDLTLGGRYSYDEKSFDLVTSGGGAFALGFGLLTADPGDPEAGPVTFDASDDESWSNFSGRVSLEYSPTDDSFLYATWSQGYKSGGYNGQATNYTAAVTPFDEETVDNYEIGFKTEFLQRRARLNVAAFYMDYQDLQVFVTSYETTAGLFVDNAGEAEITGFEAEFFLAPSERFDLSATYAWLDAELGDNELETVEEGNVLTRSPEQSASLAAQYRIPLGDLGELLLRADYAWQDKIYFQLENPEESAQDAYGLWNLRAALQAEAGWEVALWVKNAADEEYWVTAFDPGFGSDLAASSVQGNPRMWGVTGIYRW